MKTEKRYLVPNDYMADPAVHVFDGKLYIYPSHDWESGIAENDNGDHFNMKDYHVYSTDDVMNGEITDHGVVLSTEDIPWAGRQLWDCDVALKNGKYYMYFPLKDRNDIFRIGVAVSDKPYGPFVPEANPMKGSYSIDVFTAVPIRNLSFKASFKVFFSCAEAIEEPAINAATTHKNDTVVFVEIFIFI